jgi:hypothetical protein
VACPFFMPMQRAESNTWLHPARLPLGAGWDGHCTASDTVPASDELREFCNLGYAKGCSRLPADRAADAVRFSIAREADSRVWVLYSFEMNHRPGDHGTLEFQLAERRWTSLHPDPCVQKMADCYLEAYLLRKSAPTEGDVLKPEP